MFSTSAEMVIASRDRIAVMSSLSLAVVKWD